MLSVDADQVLQIAADLRRLGITTLRDAISPNWTATAREEVENYVGRHGPGDYDLMELDQWECPAIQRFAESPVMESLLESLTRASYSEYPAPGSYTRRILRIHDGTGGISSKTHVWHYDANTLTIMIPIVVPGGDAGHFGALPAHRRLRRTLLTTVEERIRNDAAHPHPGAIHKFNKAPDRHTYPLIPGQALIFSGHCTLHSPLPWPVGKLRANVILHFGHQERPESGVLRTLRTMRNAVTDRRRAGAIVV